MIRTPEESSRQLGRGLRRGTSSHLKRRRTITKLLMFASANLAVVALYQIGVLKKLPSPSGSEFDAEKVNGSAQAYSWFSIPDGFLGLASYSVSACLAAAAGEDRWKENPLVPLCMTAKLTLDAGYAGKLTWDEISRYKTISVWSLAAAAAAFIALPLAFPECKAALRRLAK